MNLLFNLFYHINIKKESDKRHHLGAFGYYQFSVFSILTAHLTNLFRFLNQINNLTHSTTATMQLMPMETYSLCFQINLPTQITPCVTAQIATVTTDLIVQ